MENMTMMTSLNNSDQRGGAYLRVIAIKKLYESIGFDVDMLYQDQFDTKSSICGLIKSLKYGKETRILFNTSIQKIPHGKFLHLDNLRHLNWKYNHNAQVIYNAHNLEFENYFKRDQQERSLKFKQYEVKKIKNTKCTWLCSQREKNIINEFDSQTEHNTFVIPNLVDKNQYHSGEKKYISFIGTLDYYPNKIAIEYMFKNIVPYFKNKNMSGLEFVIAGRNPLPEQIEEAKRLNIKMMTNLTQDEILKLYSETHTLLVPITHGSGTRLKITEALFSKANVISTPLGAEGIEEKNIQICELKDFNDVLSEMIRKASPPLFTLENSFIEQFDMNTWIENNKFKIKDAIFR